MEKTCKEEADKPDSSVPGILLSRDAAFLFLCHSWCFLTALACPFSSSLLVASTKRIVELAKGPLGAIENSVVETVNFSIENVKSFSQPQDRLGRYCFMHANLDSLRTSYENNNNKNILLQKFVDFFFFLTLFSARVCADASPAKHVQGNGTGNCTVGSGFSSCSSLDQISPVHLFVPERSKQNWFGFLRLVFFSKKALRETAFLESTVK